MWKQLRCKNGCKLKRRQVKNEYDIAKHYLVCPVIDVAVDDDDVASDDVASDDVAMEVEVVEEEEEEAVDFLEDFDEDCKVVGRNKQKKIGKFGFIVYQMLRFGSM
nr:hypothetical protein [Tanacetum cinerariifolium]